MPRASIAGNIQHVEDAESDVCNCSSGEKRCPFPSTEQDKASEGDLFDARSDQNWLADTSIDRAIDDQAAKQEHEHSNITRERNNSVVQLIGADHEAQQTTRRQGQGDCTIGRAPETIRIGSMCEATMSWRCHLSVKELLKIVYIPDIF